MKQQTVLKAEILGQLLLMQSILAGLPDEKTIFSFVCRGLSDIPGIVSVRHSPCREDSPDENTDHFPLMVGNACQGELILQISDEAAFAPYRDYLNNFCFMLAVILEERVQRSLNQAYSARLEKMVAQRTARLHDQMAEQKATEALLRRNEKMLNDIQALSHTGGWEYDVLSDQLTWSLETYRIYEVPQSFNPNEANWSSLFYDAKTRDLLKNAFSDAIHHGLDFDFEVQLQTPQGHKKWIRTIGKTERSEGRVVRVIGNIRDITLSKKAETEIREASQKWRSTFDAMLDPMVFLTPEGCIEKSNRAFAEFVHRDIKTIKGQKCHALVHDATCPIDHCPLVRCLKSKTREVTELEETDGRVLYIVADPAVNTEGEVIGIAHVIRDITDQRKAQRALQESNQRYQMVSECAYDFIITTDLNLCITFANKAVYDLLQGLDPVGVSITDFTPDQYRPVQEALMEKRRNGVADAFSFEWEMKNLSGQPFIVDVRSQLLTENGQPSGILFVARDITERKKAEEERLKLEKQLFQAQKMEAVGTLAGGIAHDFNNILAAIMGYAELIRDSHDQPMQHENIKRLLVAAERAKNLVNQILAFGRHVEQDKRPIDLKLIVKEEIKLLRATMPKTIDIRQKIANQAYTVLADITQMHQVVMNLCTNAAQAMGEKGGQLTISLSTESIDAAPLTEEHSLRPGQYVRLTVADSGPGIDETILPRIFDPFFTTKDIGKGTGLGLSVVYGIVKNHSGAVQVESRPGKGATFHIFLPLIEQATIEPRLRTDENIPGGTERLLFVDDEADLTELAYTHLSALGYSVTAFTDSREALERFKADPENYDLIITDMTMPHLSGSDLAQAILRVRPQQRIMLCTGFSSYMDEEKAARLGIKSFIMKPASRSELARAIRQILDESQPTEIIDGFA